jgi:N-acetylglucosaminyldiphosphoundecaprenol N-acetyl-beta-D-mannosaminyltransferase
MVERSTMEAADASVPATLEIRGLRLLNLALDEAVAAIEAAVAASHPTQVAFVNADCVNIAARDEAYRQRLNDMDWVFVDGIGMRLAGQMLKQPVRDNVNGTDLFPRLCKMLAARGGRLYLLGGRPGVAAAAACWAEAHHPGLQIAGAHNGYLDPADNQRVASEIRATRPDVLLVAMGAPRQEAWIGRHAAAAGATVTLGVGGLFDYYSGRIPRAPAWMRRLGLEWIFRLLQEPGRLWRRYLIGNLVFLARVGRDRLAGQVSTRKPQRRNA